MLVQAQHVFYLDFQLPEFRGTDTAQLVIKHNDQLAIIEPWDHTGELFEGELGQTLVTAQFLLVSVSSGSGEILKSSVRWGWSPNARQMRCTLVGEMPTRRASSRLDQCVAPSGTSSRVRTTTSSTWAPVIVRGTPGRGSSPSPSSRLAATC
jgi:hypothetical protein